LLCFLKSNRKFPQTSFIRHSAVEERLSKEEVKRRAAIRFPAPPLHCVFPAGALWEILGMKSFSWGGHGQNPMR
jgi:hypothetical protein